MPIVMDQAESANSTDCSVDHTNQMIATNNTLTYQEAVLTDDDDVVNNKVECNKSPISDTSDPNELRQSSVYEAVIGTNDQELARRQYSDDDDLDCEDENCSPKLKKLAVPDSVRAIKLEQDPVATNNGQDGGIQNDDHGLADSCESDGLSSVLNQITTDKNLPVVSANKSGNSHNDEPEQVRKLFIGGLDYKTSEETLKGHFERFGQVIDCVVMREPQSKRSRGFGFVIYANSLMVDKAQEARPHEVDGREVQSKRAISREDSGKPEAQATVKKVYLGGLSDDIEESELREYFAEFGNIVNVNIVAHKDTGKRRGFAFVEYDDYDPVDKIVLKKYHTIKDRRIEAKKAIPKIEMDARKRIDPRVTMAGAMMTLSGPHPETSNGRSRGQSGRTAGACLWDSPFGASYPGAYPGQAALDGYPSHYHSPPAHYGAGTWIMHGGNGGSQSGGSGAPYGFRGSHGAAGFYGRNSYANPASVGGGWTSAMDYGGFSASSQGGAGPMRLSYQHRSWAPYSNGYGSHRSSRGYNP